jgi:hypothetical protein
MEQGTIHTPAQPTATWQPAMLQALQALRCVFTNKPGLYAYQRMPTVTQLPALSESGSIAGTPTRKAVLRMLPTTGGYLAAAAPRHACRLTQSEAQ